MNQKRLLRLYHNSVINKFHIYNSLFLKLPFDDVYRTGVLLPLLINACEAGYAAMKSPHQILSEFLADQGMAEDETRQISALFKFIQYIERQIVLFDAVEEAAFTDTHALDGKGSVPHLANECDYMGLKGALQETLQDYRVRVVLTAHPTQFYPGPVLGILTDLSVAIAENDIDLIEQLLQQLGKTPLFSKQKPTPYDEAVSLVWFLENVFYHAIADVRARIRRHVFDDGPLPQNSIVEVGFWPGGDRDGNPHVTAQTTLDVARRLKTGVLKCYHRDIRKLKKRLTFDQVDRQLLDLEKHIYRAAYVDPDAAISAAQIHTELTAIKDKLLRLHGGLFVEQLQALIDQVQVFGVHFAALDVRQDSRVHTRVIETLSNEHAILPSPRNGDDAAYMQALGQIHGPLKPESVQDPEARETLASVFAMHTIQGRNGECGANRYIISNCRSAIDVMHVLALLRLSGLWPKEAIAVDIIPLFETIDDLRNAGEIMQTLYQNPNYRHHLQQRGNKQTIMLGFSDGTKDGGYLAANWSILQAKETLSALSAQAGVHAVFFDGRGGPPARGGGETHKFYASQSDRVANREIQLTIQGQTISSKFGTADSAQYNLEQLLSAGLGNAVGKHRGIALDDAARALMQELCDTSLAEYERFKHHPMFMPYLEKISTLKYYGQTNIGSRPVKRSGGGQLVFEDLRAIPFVGAWSQLKQNVLGYFGVGTALQSLRKAQQWDAAQQLYLRSGFFSAMLDNSMMSICKSYMPLTQYLSDDAQFGEFWRWIYTEFTRATEELKAISGQPHLLADRPLRLASIEQRERIVLPLLTIQQHALQRIAQLNKDPEANAERIAVYEKMVTRSLYGNVNASRNSV